MRNGEFEEGRYTLRAKIDLASGNFNMRDPVLYRIRYIEHHRQGTKWCIFPMYDFAHPIQDAIEGITHSARLSMRITVRFMTGSCRMSPYPASSRDR